MTATAEDGTEIHAWLVLPASEQPAPLLLWIHGGPLGSWNDWSWRWNPWIMAAKGYAVLLPDPAMSTGYGQRMIDRGWGEWGPVTHGDLMAITDAACKLPEIDEARTAAMGGSFGGYMANWVAGHTDRFKAIVTHASLWNLDQFAGTTDVSSYWQREFGAPGSDRYRRLSPHHWLDRITTPMLVIHGDKDYRVPIGEALRLWWDLQRTGAEAKFLYFPDENHWILKPGNTIAWYDTMLGVPGPPRAGGGLDQARLRGLTTGLRAWPRRRSPPGRGRRPPGARSLASVMSGRSPRQYARPSRITAVMGLRGRSPGRTPRRPPS